MTVSMAVVSTMAVSQTVVSQTVSVSVSVPVSVSVDGGGVSDAPLANEVSTASVAGGLDSVAEGGGPGGGEAPVVSVSLSLRGGEGGHSQTGGDQELVHDDSH